MSALEIVVVEDEPKIARLLADYLENDGFRVTVLEEGSHAVETIKAHGPVFVILDLMLPGKDGLTICKEVRQFSQVPIMILTAKVDEIDRLLGLELGADDYVCKPFMPREVVARVRTILRRVQSPVVSTDSNEVVYRHVRLEVDRHRCTVDGSSIELTAVEFRVLQALMSHPGRVFSRDSLMDASYTDHRIVSHRTIDTHIKNLRRKLAGPNASDELIHSIYGVGYKIE